MLFGWKSPGQMKRGLGRSVLAEAEKFYVDYLDRLFGSDDDEESDNDPPWEAEAMTGEMT